MTRREALSAGLIRYFTGRPCVYGHVSERFSGSGNCVECSLVYSRLPEIAERSRSRVRAWASSNHERALAVRREWVKKNPEIAARHRRRWNEKNIDRVREYARQKAKKQRIERPELKRFYESIRRARLHQAMPRWVNRKEIAAVYKACPPGLHVDHIVPLAGREVCGLHVTWNLQYLTPSENSIKKNKLIVLERVA